MPDSPIKKIIELAAKIGGILALPILLIGVLFWVFSPGSFDALWSKLAQVSGDQTFILLLAIFGGFIFLVFDLALLWYLLERAKLRAAAPDSFPISSVASGGADNHKLLEEKIHRLRRG